MSERIADDSEMSDLDDLALPPIPSSWCWATPRELAAPDEYALSIGPFGSNLKVSDYREEGVPLVFVRNIRSGQYGGSSTKYVSEQKANQLVAHSVDPGDVVITKMGEPPGDAGIYPESEPRAIITADCIKFRVNARLGTSRFYVHVVNSHIGKSQIALITKGVAQQKISLGRFAQLRFPVPPLTEQRRIVAKIEELFSDLDAGVAALERAKANLKRYRAAVLKAAVEGKLTEAWRAEHPNTEPASKLLERILIERRKTWEADQLAKFAAAKKEPPKNWKEKYVEPTPPETADLPELPKGWCWTSVEQVALSVRYGSSAKTNEDLSGVPVLRMGNIVDGTLDWTELKYLPKSHDEFPDLLLAAGELLFNRTNSAELVGKSAVYDGQHDPCSYASYLISVRTVAGCDSRFLCSFINSAHGRRWVKSVVSQQVGQANVNGTKLQALAFPLPPVDEQDQIMAEVAEKFSQIDAALAEAESSLRRAARLRQSILKQAFEGKLVPQDPKDEPANVLLDRMRATQRVHEQNGKSDTPARSRGRRAKQYVEGESS